jgi:hypothetical protein
VAQQACEEKKTDPSSQPSQSQAAPPAATQTGTVVKSQTPDRNKEGQDTSGANASGTSKDRLFYALPNFLTLENSSQVPPLPAKEKFKVVTKGSFDYVQIPWYGFLAAVSQAEDSEAEFGQGAAGYGKRFGSYVADGTIENFMTGAILPSLLRQDPRYFQSGKGSFMHRTEYSVSRILITRVDSGGNQFNYSEVFGSAIASGISTYSYHPHADRTVANAFSVWGSQVGYDTITLVIKEFWPDIRRSMQKKKHPEQ